jgi:3-deoxy-manno-octulosonate cytidylyltransferase (CMP-KDO synthetase)
MNIVGIIPSRIASTRLANKPLIEIDGHPLIAHVICRAKASKILKDIYVATDSEDIANVAIKYGAIPIMTDSNISNGTERVAIANKEINADIVVHINGDEVLLSPKDIDLLIDSMTDVVLEQPGILYRKTTEFNDESIFKVLVNKYDDVFCLTRSDVPSNARNNVEYMYAAYFVTIYHKEHLSKYINSEASLLEEKESCNEMRFIEMGINYKGVFTDTFSLSIYVPDDLIKLESMSLSNDYL